MISLEQIRESSNVHFSDSLTPELPKENIIDFLNLQLEHAGLERTIKPLTGIVLPFQTEENIFHVPESLTKEQIQAILYMAPGVPSVDIGQLTNSLRLREGGMPWGALTDVSLVVTLEYVDSYNTYNSHSLKPEEKNQASTWQVYGIDKAGNITSFGVQL